MSYIVQESYDDLLDFDESITDLSECYDGIKDLSESNTDHFECYDGIKDLFKSNTDLSEGYDGDKDLYESNDDHLEFDESIRDLSEKLRRHQRAFRKQRRPLCATRNGVLDLDDDVMDFMKSRWLTCVLARRDELLQHPAGRQAHHDHSIHTVRSQRFKRLVPVSQRVCRRTYLEAFVRWVNIRPICTSVVRRL